MAQHIRTQLTIFLAYFVAGFIGLQFVSAGFSSAVWPPAGIAMAAMILYGPKSLPSILFAASAATYLNHSGEFEILNLLVALVTGIGASLQAYVGYRLIKHYVGLDNNLHDAKAIIIFSLIIGPISSVINSTISISTLYMLGYFPSHTVLESWFTWWLGDAIGAVIFTPAILIFFAEPAEVWRRKIKPVGIPLICVFVCCVGLYSMFVKLQTNKVLLSMTSYANSRFDIAIDNFKNSVRAVESVKNFYDSSMHVDRKEFKIFVDPMLKEYPYLKAIGWLPRILDKDRMRFERELDELFSGRTILESGEKGLIKANPKSEYFPVFYVEPLLGHDRAVGYDISSNAIRKEAANDAITSGATAISRRVVLVSETEKTYSVLIISPVYIKDKPLSSNKQKEQNTMGIVTGVVRINTLLEGSIHKSALKNLHVELVDTTASESEKMLYYSKNIADKSMLLRKPFTMGNRVWELIAYPTPYYLDKQMGWFKGILLLFFALLTGVVSVFFQMLHGKEYEIQKKYDRKSLQLSRTKRELELILHSSAEAVFSIDARGNVAFMNKAACALTGYSQEELLDSPLDGLIKGTSTEGVFKRKDGVQLPVDFLQAPIKDGNDKESGEVILVRDITMRKERDDNLNKYLKQLEKSNKELDEFAYTVAHDLSSPLQGLRALVTGISDDKETQLSKESRAYMGKLQKRLESLEGLVYGLLKFARAGQLSRSQTELSLCQIVDELSDKLRVKYKNFTVDTEAMAVDTIKADKAALMTVLKNLMENSVKHQDKSETLIVISTYQDEKWLHFKIEDDGPGIPEEYYTKIFQLFQANMSSAYTEGSGIGLAIVRRVLQTVDGRISVQSNEPRGVVFHVQWPIS